MQTLAVTGTNGKTSTVEFCRQLFGAAGFSAASYGTLGLVTDAGRTPDPPMAVGPWALPGLLSRLDVGGTDAVALEAFSSSLASDAYDETVADVAAFTNLDRDHLDVHGDVESYFAAKRRLFETVLHRDGTAVLNADDGRSTALDDCCRERGVDVVTYGRSADADVRVRRSAPSPTGTTAELVVDGRRERVVVDVVGDVMLSNACCALSMVLAAGLPARTALAGLTRLRAPPGRVERVGSVDGVETFVDYAHTPAALRAVLETLRPRTAGSLVVVFGCGGDRDPGKRRPMGTVAETFADRVVVTDDNPRTEDPAAIRAAIRSGCPAAAEVPDRREAIAAAIETASAGDVVVVAGKGHERTQTVGSESRPFSDHEEVLRHVRDERGSDRATSRRSRGTFM